MDDTLQAVFGDGRLPGLEQEDIVWLSKHHRQENISSVFANQERHFHEFTYVTYLYFGYMTKIMLLD